MAALHALFWTLLKSGDRVIYPNVSLIFPQPSYDERINLYPEKFRKGFIRFSVGLEEPKDIIADLDQALNAIGL